MILETLIEILVVPKLNLVPAGREFIPSIKVTRTLAFQAVAGLVLSCISKLPLAC